jgi:hypothetical protein
MNYKKYSILICSLISFFILLVSLAYSAGLPKPMTPQSGSNPAISPVNPAQTTQQVPFSPSNLILEVISPDQINVKWNDTSTNELGFAVERKTGNGQFIEIGRVGQNVVIYNDKGLSANSSYTYRIRAYNNAGYSPYTEEKSATTQSLKFISTTDLSKSSSDQKLSKDILAKANQTLAVKLQEQSQKKLFELQNAENNKKIARIQNLKLQISAQHNSVLQSACIGTAIKSFYPTEAYPGDPVNIEGCGFQNDEGMVVLSEYNKKLIITHWSDTLIQAVIPDDLSGFADPKNISVKVATVQGNVVGSQSILLKPTIEVKEYNPIVSWTIAPNTSDCTGFGNDGTGSFFYASAMHFDLYNSNISCTGADIMGLNLQSLQNNWIYTSLDVNVSCWDRNSNPGNCSGGISVSSNIHNCIGSKSCPNQSITVNWNFNGKDNSALFYLPQIFIAGPKGTNPY